MRCEAEGLLCTRKPSRRGQRKATPLLGLGPATDYIETAARCLPSSLRVVDLADPRLRRSLCYFREKTARRMSHNQHFWDCLVLQVSQYHAAILHAIVALGAIDESLVLMHQDKDSTQGKELHRLSFQQWNQSIALMTHHAAVPPSAGILLLSCALYRMLETMIDGIDSGLEILRKALEFLQQWRTSDPSVSRTMSEAELVDKHVSPMIRSASEDFEFLAKDNDFIVRPCDGRAEDDVVFPLLPQSYAISEVYKIFKIMSNKIGSEIGGLLGEEYMLHLDTAICRSESLLKNWYQSTRFIVGPASSSDPETSQRAAVLLQIRYNVAMIQLRTALFRDEMLFDAHNAAFRKIVELCQEVERLEAEESKSTSATTVIHTLDLRIIMPLVLVAARCRDPTIRRQAVHVLLSSGRMERIWCGRVAGMMVKQIVDIEERELTEVKTSADIPASHRIRLLKFHYDPGIAGMSGYRPPAGFLDAKDHLAPEVKRNPDRRSPSFVLEWIRQPFDEKSCKVESTTVPLSVEDSTNPRGPVPSPWSVHLAYDWHTQWQMLLLKCGAHPGLKK